MRLYLLDYGAGNVQSLANTLTKLGHEFSWISSPADFDDATALIFPGVGAFGSAIQGLHDRGLFEPLRAYINSGRPYFGICIGLQVLFRGSAESPGSVGLGIIPSSIDRFDDTDKSVPHMGWNSLEFLDQANKPDDGMKETAHYYFVHSYCAKFDAEANPGAAVWAHTMTQYGNQAFISSVNKSNVFATQFHPEKSGGAGLQLIDSWLKNPVVGVPPTPRLVIRSHSRSNLTKRIIACMDVRANDDGDLVVTKGDQYDVREKAETSAATITIKTAGAVRNLGKPVALAARYYEQGVDELCLLNITSFRHSPLHDQPMLAVVRAAAACVFVPLTIGGGIKDTTDPDGTRRSALEVASAYFRAGADKVSIGSEAVYAAERWLANGRLGDGTSAMETIAHAYGRQAVVVSVDPRRVYVDKDTYDGPFKNELIHGVLDGPAADRGKTWWYQCTVSGGREARDVSVVQLAHAAEALGAGELLLNSIDRDGTGLGFDLELIKLVKRNVHIPIVASSGAGNAAHFVDAFSQTSVEAALAAGIFHREEVTIGEVKRALGAAGINTRIER